MKHLSAVVLLASLTLGTHAQELSLIHILIVRESTTAQIAERMGISAKTVEVHRRNIMIKLDIRNMAGMVKYAMDRGWNI